MHTLSDYNRMILKFAEFLVIIQLPVERTDVSEYLQKTKKYLLLELCCKEG